MNLSEMAGFICREIGQLDPVSNQICRTCIQKEYENLWDRYDWLDSRMTVPVNVGASSNSIPYPDDMGRVITIRAGGDRFLEPISSTFLIETDPTIFERTGAPLYYEEKNVPEDGRAIMIFPAPAYSTSFLIVGKRVCPKLVADADTLLLRNCDNVVIAYAYADMLRRIRMFAKANDKRQEAKELEASAVELEQQQANRPRATKNLTVAGNSLAEMTDAVCAICGQWTPESRILIREFLRRNYQILYDLFLFPETMLGVWVPYNSEQVIMPEYVDKIIGVRGTAKDPLLPMELPLWLNLVPSVFEDIGVPVSFTMQTSVAVSILPPVSEQLILSSTSNEDTNVTGRDAGRVFIMGEIQGREVREEVQLNGFTPVLTANQYDVPITIAKGITAGDVTVSGATSGLILERIPAQRREMKHLRIWLLPNPNGSEAPPFGSADTWKCLVLAKRRIVPLVTEEDTPIISSCQQVLIHGAAADCFRKAGQVDQAREFEAKASAGFIALKTLHTDQAAHIPRFIPVIEPHAYVLEGCWK
jgi:hypothetical protein